jgi:outer membrane protein assembly factor BamB
MGPGRFPPFAEEFPMSDAASQVQPFPMPAGIVLEPAAPRLRLWPAVIIVAVQWLVVLVPAWTSPGTPLQLQLMQWGSLIGSGLVVAWWLFASRARWIDRFLVLAFLAAASLAAYPLYHEKFNYRLYGPMMRALPLSTTAWVVWLLISTPLSWPVRRVGIFFAILLALGYCMTLRFDGADSNFSAQVNWRWSVTPEEQFLRSLPAHSSQSPDGEAAPSVQPGDWPAFRGPNRDGRLTGVRIATDWKDHAPGEVWRHRVGPGWGSFAVVGDRLYTQEQRGPDEVVVCYNAADGTERWTHTDAARFDETIGGPGPRATPTFHEGKLYTQGASGILNCLDAGTGAVYWSRNTLADSGRDRPHEWGFASSPLVAEGVVTVFAGGPDGKSVLAYHAASGEPAWSAGMGREGYSSTHLANLGETEQLLIATNLGLTSFDPARGTLLWQHDWPMEQGGRILQPLLVGDSDVLIGTVRTGLRRVKVTHSGDAWATSQVWQSPAAKPYFDDLVEHQGHVYGFDSSFLTCVSLADGKGRWRARYPHGGQALLLADQGLLLILLEGGEVALVEANPERHVELGRFKAIDGKTWNHPVVAHGKLFVRNGEEMACFALRRDGE